MLALGIAFQKYHRWKWYFYMKKKKKKWFWGMRYDANTIVTIRILYTFLPDRCDYLKEFERSKNLHFTVLLFAKCHLLLLCSSNVPFPPILWRTNLCQETKEVDGKPSTKIHTCLGINSMVRCFVHHSYRSRFPLPKKNLKNSRFQTSNNFNFNIPGSLARFLDVYII